MLRKYSFTFWIFPISLLSQYDLNEYIVDNLPLPVELANSNRILTISISTAFYSVAKEKVSRLCVQMSKIADSVYTFMPVSRIEKKTREFTFCDDDNLPI